MSYQPRKIETCKLIRHYSYYLGSPRIFTDRCEGYTGEDCDEPCMVCKECKFLDNNKESLEGDD